MIDGATSLTIGAGRGAKDGNVLFRVHIGERDVLGIPSRAKDLQTRVVACAHMTGAGFRRVVAAFQWLHEYCCWFRMEIHSTYFAKRAIVRQGGI